MLVYDGLRDWIDKNNLHCSELLGEGEKVSSIVSSLLCGISCGTTKTLNRLCEVTGLEIEQLVRWVPDSTKRISDIYRDKEPCYDRMLAILKEKNISKKDLSDLTGISMGTIGKGFNTQKKKGAVLSYDTLKKIADVLGVSPLDLFEPKDECIEQREADKRKIADMELPDGLKKVIDSSGKNLNQISAGSGVHYSGLYNAVKKGGKLTEENINRLKSYFKWEE